jgi:hypothetical protein
LLTGYNGKLTPTESLTRAQMATIMAARIRRCRKVGYFGIHRRPGNGVVQFRHRARSRNGPVFRQRRKNGA